MMSRLEQAAMYAEPFGLHAGRFWPNPVPLVKSNIGHHPTRLYCLSPDDGVVVYSSLNSSHILGTCPEVRLPISGQWIMASPTDKVVLLGWWMRSV